MTRKEKKLANAASKSGMQRLIPNLFDEYVFKARYIPAVVISVPLMLLMSLIPNEELKSLFRYAGLFMVVKNVGMGMVLVLFLTHVVRALGKYLIEYWLFDDGLGFPTTYMLLWCTRQISKQQKAAIHAKIKDDFDISLLSEDDERRTCRKPDCVRGMLFPES